MKRYDVIPPRKWHAGWSGKTELFFSCADCETPDATIAGVFSTDGTIRNIGIITKPPDATHRFPRHFPALFCRPCWSTRCRHATSPSDPPLRLPRQHSTLPLEISSCDGFCSRCGRQITALRGTVHEYPTCLELDAMGVCPRCHVLNSFLIRWYSWSLLHRTNDGWTAYPVEIPWWRRLLHHLQGLWPSRP